MIGVIGLGQAGGNIADLFAENGVPTIVMNYSSKDLETCTFVEHKLKLVGSEGVGKQRDETIRLFINNYETAMSFIKERFSTTSIEVIFIVFSTAGGSGSGIASLLSEILLNEMEDKVFVICPIIPTSCECLTGQLNTLDTLTSLSELEVCIAPIDNEKGMLNEGKSKGYDSINHSFVKMILSIVEYTEKHSKNGNFDARDLRTLFSTPGFCSMGEFDVTKIKGEGISLSHNHFTEKIQASHMESVFCNPSRTQIVRAGFIYDGQESLTKYINIPNIIQPFANQPLDVFEGYHESEKGRMISVYTGMKFNEEKLTRIEKLTKESVNSFQSVQQSTTISISVNRPSISKGNKSKNKKVLSDILNKHAKKIYQEKDI